MTNEDRLRLYQNVLNCRRNLIDADILRKPTDSLATNFLRSTLRRLSKHKLEKLRQEFGAGALGEGAGDGSGDCYKGFPYAYWAFSKHQLNQSLTKLPEPEEQVAIQVFTLILQYAGLISSGNLSHTSTSAYIRSKEIRSSLGFLGHSGANTEEEQATLLQAILDKSWRKENILTELYLQLLKQTTDHPEPNSKVNQRHWAALGLLCSLVPPTNALTRKYLFAHLKRCRADSVTEEGRYARFADKVSSYHSCLLCRALKYSRIRETVRVFRSSF